jgi:hypothetical protein
MTYQQLIKKLRWGWRFVEGQDISNRDLEQAATSIEELMKERDDLGRKLNTARYGQPDFAWSIHEEAMADLRAKLTKAMEALRETDQAIMLHTDETDWRLWGEVAVGNIRTTLAELEGK